jgi:hypothetical protein
MARDRGDASLHKRLMNAVVRGARAQEDSRAVVEQHAAVDAQVRTTLAAVRELREQRAQRTRRAPAARNGG